MSCARYSPTGRGKHFYCDFSLTCRCNNTGIIMVPAGCQAGMISRIFGKLLKPFS
jgi:hypothetical protein